MSDLAKCGCLAGNPPMSAGPHDSGCPAHRGPLPHKQVLAIERGVRRYKNDRWLYAGPDVEVAVVVGEAPGGADLWAKFFQAAPLVAQALLATGAYRYGEELWHTHHCFIFRKEVGAGSCTLDCEEARAALTAAGVLK